MPGLIPSAATCEIPKGCLDTSVGYATDAMDYTGCLMKCKESEECKWFTFHTDSSICILWEGCKEFEEGCTECISGEVTCPICEITGKCHSSTLLGITFPRDATRCINDCKTTKNCLWYSYDTRNKDCYLYDKCEDFHANNTLFVSGEVSCPSNDCNLIGFCQVK